MAMLPQMTTRIAPLTMLAPPTHADKAPNVPSKISDDKVTIIPRFSGGKKATNKTGITPPVTKETAEANAA